MSYNVCSISGLLPVEPVISRTGYIFEKRLIIKHLEQDQRCPITNEPMNQDDLIPLQSSKYDIPRNISDVEMPSMLKTLQTQWNELIVELNNTRKELEESEKELSHSLYQHDASVKVICRLIKERDEIRNRILAYNKEIEDEVDNEEYEEEAEKGLTEEIIEMINEKALELSQGRRKRVIPAELAKVEVFKVKEGHKKL